ncbi:MAG: DUF4349 domain-containing protein [Bacteroidia bacterium]
MIATHLKHCLGLLLLFSFVACERNLETPESGSFVLESSASKEANIESKAENPNERKLIKEGEVEFETNDLNETRTTILKAVNKYDGYVSSDQEYNYSGKKSNTLKIRVPSKNFDNFLNEATKGVEKFDDKVIEVKDVTEEFLDVEARLKTKKELEQRYIELLKEANNVIEVLEIEKQIGLLRSEIESIEGRLKYLQDRVSFSTLAVTFYELTAEEKGYGSKFSRGFSNGWENLVLFFVALVNIWPFILITIGIVLGIRLYRKRSNR